MGDVYYTGAIQIQQVVMKEKKSADIIQPGRTEKLVVSLVHSKTNIVVSQ